jgi:hypothetical protein
MLAKVRAEYRAFCTEQAEYEILVTECPEYGILLTEFLEYGILITELQNTEYWLQNYRIRNIGYRTTEYGILVT